MIKIRFYMSEDGEVLSNKEYPVSRRLCVIPQIEGPPRPIHVDVWSELEVSESFLKYKVYKAICVKVPEDFFSPLDGLIR